MSKYDPLSQRLHGHGGDEWRASFNEIEEVLGFPLPKTARTKAWWANDSDKSHVKAWLEKGWEAHEVDHDQGAVTFRRSAISPAAMNTAAGLAPVGDLSAAEPPEVPKAPAPPSSDLVTTGPAVAPGPEPSRPNMRSAVGVGAMVAASVALLAGIGALAMRGLARRR